VVFLIFLYNLNIMKNLCLSIVFMFFMFDVAPVCGAAEKKYLVMVADVGSAGPGQETMDVLKKYPGIKIAMGWPASIVPGKEIAGLARDKRIEIALRLDNEPVLPLLFETRLSSPVAVDFSWPQDINDIVFRNQHEFRRTWSSFADTQWDTFPAGLFLRSGVFSTKLAPVLRKLGLRWVLGGKLSSLESGVYLKDGFYIMANDSLDGLSAADCWKFIMSSPGRVVVISGSERTLLNPETLAFIGARLKETPAIIPVTPAQLIRKHQDLIINLGDALAESDLTPWTKRPEILNMLSRLRRDIEQYKNSGRAQLKTLDALRDDIYSLYRFDTLARVMDTEFGEDERRFRTAVRNAYHILRLPVPSGDLPANNAPADNDGAVSVPFVESGHSSLVITNTNITGAGTPLKSFAVTVSTESVLYKVALSTGASKDNFVVDIYMDLNGKRGAGYSSFLPGVSASVRPEDAWEFAFRLQKNEAVLYRYGRAGPVAISTFKAAVPGEIRLPRTLLRGNPLLWSYQAIVLNSPAAATGKWRLRDFLCADMELRNNAERTANMRLPFIGVGDNSQ